MKVILDPILNKERADYASAIAPGTYENPLTFSTGLTRATNTITANLSVGVAGGQSAIGGNAASENLTLSSTSHATKGKILFGTSAYDEANNRLGIGVASPSVTGHFYATSGEVMRIATGAFGDPKITWYDDIYELFNIQARRTAGNNVYLSASGVDNFILNAYTAGFGNIDGVTKLQIYNPPSGAARTTRTFAAFSGSGLGSGQGIVVDADGKVGIGGTPGGYAAPEDDVFFAADSMVAKQLTTGATGGSPLQDSFKFTFQTAYWDGAASQSRTMYLRGVQASTAPSEKIGFFDSSNVERLAIHNAGMVVMNGELGVGITSSLLGKIHAQSTTGAQFVGSYDASNYFSTTVASNGLTQFNAVGSGAAFQFLDTVYYLGKSTTNSNSTFFGLSGTGSLMTGDYNTVFGAGSFGSSATTADSNAFFGDSIATALTTGQANIGVGRQSLQDLTTGSANVAIGFLTFNNLTTGNHNTGVGNGVGQAITTEQEHTFLGSGAGGAISGVNRIVALGCQAIGSTTGGAGSIGIGYRASYKISGADNVIIGNEAFSVGTGTGANNVAIGGYTGYGMTNGSGNIFLGYFSGRYTTTESNYLLINNTATGKANIIDERNKSLVYAKMDSDPLNQAFVLNGVLYLKDTNSGNYFTAVITSGAWVLTDTGSANAPS